MKELEKEPSAVNALWQGWKRIAKRFGEIQARGFLSLFYFTVLTPFALAVRWADPLAIKSRSQRGWRLVDDSQSEPMQRAGRQF